MELDTLRQREALYQKYALYFEEQIGKHWTAKKLAIATMYLRGDTTLEKVGKEYGISKERVRQIVVAFLRQVKDIYVRNKSALRAMEAKQQPLSQVDKLDTALVKFGDMLRGYIREEIEEAVQRQVRSLMATKYPSLSQQEPEAQEPMRVRGGYTLAEITEILDMPDNNFDGSLKRLGIRLGRTESIVYNIRSNYRKWKRAGGSSSSVLHRFYQQYELAKQDKKVIGNLTEAVQKKGDASLPEMSDPEAGGVIGYYMDDIKAYLGSDEKFADFEEWYRGKTGGIYNGNFYVFKYDFQHYLGNSISDTKVPKILTHWTIDEVEVALDAEQDEIHEVADLLNRTYNAVKSLRWRYRMFKNGQGSDNVTEGAIELFKQYEKLKGGEEHGRNKNSNTTSSGNV